ncbi:MAG: flagellar brake protein [Cellvibrionaceae bacterium]
MGIFNKVLYHLSKNKVETEAKDTNNRLLAQINRYASLIRLQDERQLIEVITEKRSDSFQSMIVGVDLYNQQLILDDFSPRIQNREALLGQTLILRHQHNRQMLKVTSEVLAWEEGSQCFLLKLPEDVQYHPRRQESRIFLPSSVPLSATIDPIYGAPWYASITNISAGGMRILVTGDLRSQLHKHKPLKKCDIALDSNTAISCKGRVKSFSYHGRPYRRTEISIAFESMNEEDQYSLHSFLEQLSIAA